MIFFRHFKGRTVSAEKGEDVQPVFVFFHNTVESLSLRGSTREINETMLMAVDIFEASAKSDFDSARSLLSNWNHPGNWELLEANNEAWEKTWDQGLVRLSGNLPLQKTAIFSMYYLLSSMPPMFASQPPQYNQVFYGPTRTGLGRGGKGKDYQGHMFWDTEVYMFPAVLFFYPEMAKRLLRYRSAKSQEAKEYADEIGAEGYRFPWESALSGFDVTPDGCPACKERAIHVSGAVAWAIRQYYTATRDRDYMTNPDYNGCDMTREIAKFYASLAKYNSSKGRYDIDGKVIIE